MRVYGRMVAELRAGRAWLRPGVDVGRGVRLGPGTRIDAQGTGRVIIGAGVEIGGGTQVVVQSGALVVIGERTFIAAQCIIAAADRVEIGCESMLAEMVCVRDHDHDPDSPPRSGRMLVQSVRIGDRTWLASKSSVVRGGGVGDDSAIGAHALVNRVIPFGVLAAGYPPASCVSG